MIAEREAAAKLKDLEDEEKEVQAFDEMVFTTEKASILKLRKQNSYGADTPQSATPRNAQMESKIQV